MLLSGMIFCNRVIAGRKSKNVRSNVLPVGVGPGQIRWGRDQLIMTCSSKYVLMMNRFCLNCILTIGELQLKD